MAKSKESAAALADRVKQALRAVAEAEGDVPLTGKAGSGALFEGTAAATKPAVSHLEGIDPPWVTTWKEGKSEYVRLTAAGFAEVLPALPPQQVAAAAKRVAGALPIGERVAFYDDVVRRLPEAAVGLVAEQRAAVDAEKADADARLAAAAKRRDLEEATRKALREWEALQDERRRVRIDTLRRELEIEGAKDEQHAEHADDDDTHEPESDGVVSENRGGLLPRSGADVSYRREVAGRLVSSWLDAIRLKKDEARRFLETAIGNVPGFREIGEEGARVPFDGLYHVCDDGVSTGTPVAVVRTGWLLDEPDGRETVVAKAQVSRRGA